jgi:hypothetical protein
MARPVFPAHGPFLRTLWRMTQCTKAPHSGGQEREYVQQTFTPGNRRSNAKLTLTCTSGAMTKTETDSNSPMIFGHACAHVSDHLFFKADMENMTIFAESLLRHIIDIEMYRPGKVNEQLKIL